MKTIKQLQSIKDSLGKKIVKNNYDVSKFVKVLSFDEIIMAAIVMKLEPLESHYPVVFELISRSVRISSATTKMEKLNVCYQVSEVLKTNKEFKEIR